MVISTRKHDDYKISGNMSADFFITKKRSVRYI